MQSMATQTSVGDDTAEEIRRAPLLGQALLRDAAVGLCRCLYLDNLFATVIAGGANVVTQVDLSRGGLNRGRRVGQKIMRTVHAAL